MTRAQIIEGAIRRYEMATGLGRRIDEMARYIDDHLTAADRNERISAKANGLAADHYRLFVECRNCGFRGHIDIRKGRALDGLDGPKCPTCECRTLGRDTMTRWDSPRSVTV